MWLGEQITERGVGNGMSLLIFAGIVVGLPKAVVDLAQKARSAAWGSFTIPALIVLVAIAPGFATLGNLLNVLRTVSMLGIIAFGMTAVIIAGEIDLSVGAGAALAGCIVAWFAGEFRLMPQGRPALPGRKRCITAPKHGKSLG